MSHAPINFSEKFARFGERWSPRIIAQMNDYHFKLVKADGVGRVRHLYVLAAYRRLGAGRQLVEQVLDAARGRFERLRLSTQNPAAARLYERLGFERRAAADHTHLLELG